MCAEASWTGWAKLSPTSWRCCPPGEDHPGITVGSLYLPKGATPDGDAAARSKYERKMRFLARLARVLTASRRRAQREGRESLVLGDFNIAHAEADLKNWKANRKSEGFLPEERAWFSSVLGPRTLHDVVRELHPDRPGPYSWWSWRGSPSSTTSAGGSTTTSRAPGWPLRPAPAAATAPTATPSG